MKLEKLQRLQQKHPILKSICVNDLTDITDLVTNEAKTNDFLNNLATLKNESFCITYTEWTKKKYDKSNVAVSTKVAITSPIVDFTNKFINQINVCSCFIINVIRKPMIITRRDV